MGKRPDQRPVHDTAGAVWRDRVAYAPAGGVALRPGEILVRVGEDDEALSDRVRLALRRLRDRGIEIDEGAERVLGYQRLRSTGDPLLLVEELAAEGLTAQLNHVVFDHCGCGPHPARGHDRRTCCGDELAGNPYSGNPYSGNPYSGNPYSGNPEAGLTYSNPALAAGSTLATTGKGRSLARPAPPQVLADLPGPASSGGPGKALVAVLDVALPDQTSRWLPATAAAWATGAPPGTWHPPGGPDGDGDGYLDRVAGHGLFVGGRVMQGCPAADLLVVAVLSNDGDGDEWTVAATLADLAGRVDVINLSFGGYALRDMALLASAVRRVQTTPGPTAQRLGRTGAGTGTVVVASAGNDATCHPPYPAALPGVVSVAALGPLGPAPFTNYGPWVSACAPGVDVVSTFFQDFDGAESPATAGDADTDAFRGAARWSGTSFAAPLVAGRIARLVAEAGVLPEEAVRRLLDGPGVARLPGLGAVVTA